jgi:hypothetical protein
MDKTANQDPVTECHSSCLTREVDVHTGPLRLHVIATTDEGTRAALRMAAARASELGARITLIAAVVVRRHLLQQKISAPTLQTEQQLYKLVRQAGISLSVNVEVFACHDQYQYLLAILKPHSLVVIGGSEQSYRERELATFLKDRGHHVIFASCDSQRRSSDNPTQTDAENGQSSLHSDTSHSVGAWSGYLPYWCR